jgi:hypothetical protein
LGNLEQIFAMASRTVSCSSVNPDISITVLRDEQTENGRDCFQHDALTVDAEDLRHVVERLKCWRRGRSNRKARDILH